MTFRLDILSGDLAVPTFGSDRWCHLECCTRWVQCPERGFLGGHIHFDGEAWRVPSGMTVPLRVIGTFGNKS